MWEREIGAVVNTETNNDDLRLGISSLDQTPKLSICTLSTNWRSSGTRLRDD